MQFLSEMKPSAEAGKRILVVDDLDDARLLVRCGISKSIPEVQVRESGSGMKAAVELAKQKFDLVVSDLNMGGGNGFWLHCFMVEYYKDVPLIFFTSNPDDLAEPAPLRKVFSKDNIAGLLKEVAAVLGQTDRVTENRSGGGHDESF